MPALPSPPAWTLRPLTAADVPALLRVQAACYGDQYVEPAAVFTQRLSSPHHCSWGVELPGQPGVQAYLAAYWSHPGKVTPLHGPFTAPQPGHSEILYLHDMAVLPSLAGQGVATALLRTLWTQAQARGVSQAALVSVQDSQAYWARQGFAVANVADAQQLAHLQTYGEDAVYMVAVL